MPNRYTQRILRLLSRRDYQPLKLRSVAHALNVPDELYPIFKQAVDKLQQQEKVVSGPQKTLTLPSMPQVVTGTYQQAAGGYGFVRPQNAVAQEDLFIPHSESGDAVSGDTVEARVVKHAKRGGQMRLFGRVSKVIERANSQVVGALAYRDNQWMVLPDGKAVAEPVTVDDPGAKNAKIGDKVRVEIISYPTERYYAHGVIIEKLGKTGTDTAELKAVIHRYNLPGKFPRPVINDARRAVRLLDHPENLTDHRENITGDTIITIDPVDARDFDDAISLKKRPKGIWELGVHIADVSTFVTPDSPLDREAHDRANSVYLPGNVIPMLPELLSNGVCSLQQDQDRFVKSAYIRYDKNGKVLSTRFANSTIRSTRRLTYEDAEDILAGKTLGFSKPVVKLLKDMEQLARTIRKRRQHDGMLSLDLPKAELVYDGKGRVVDARPESTSFPHTMIEMFMVEANEAVARLFDSIPVPFLRRVHPEPDSLAKGETARVIKLCGLVIPKNINRKGLQQLLNSVRGTPQSFIVNLAILKSLQRAEYNPAPMGHYALASEHYCHFTSPIRRYPDLTIHRLLQAYLEGKLTADTVDDFPSDEDLQTLGRHCSDTERNAEQAENDLRQLKILQMLEHRVGEELNAVVTSIVNFGIFVQCERILVEGLIKADDILRQHNKRSRRDKKQHRQSKGRQPQGGFIKICPYKLGEELRVRIAAVNPAARTLDLVPV